jgi:hypothetical protein
MRAETISEQLFFTTVRLECTGEVASVGTGFVYAVETEQGTAHFLVTNKHVLDGAKAITVRMVRSRDGLPLLGEATDITLQGVTEESWVGHPDPEVDVAVLALAPVIKAMEDRGAPPFFRSLMPEHLPSSSLLDELDAIEQVTFVGYPNGLYDTANLLPIARRGSTATPLDVDYQGKPAFLIDASVFPGSSGSPVFLLDRGIYQNRDGGTVVGGRFACLGIVAAVHIRRVDGSVVDVATALGVQFDEPIDLGIVFKAKTIDETVDHLLSKVPLQRVAAPPTAPPGELTDADDAIADEIGPEA